jgi:hypothetical protein
MNFKRRKRMPEPSKGINELYDLACQALWDTTFYSWHNNSGLSVGQICTAPAWYEKYKRWYLETAKYDAFNEANTSWKAIEYPQNGNIRENKRDIVQKYFDLGKNEHMLTTHCKRRPVIILKQSESGFFDTLHPKIGWFCYPIFTYKPRHSQHEVLQDQALLNSIRFYMPRKYNNNPGIPAESVVHLDSIQVIESKYLEPCFLENDEQKRKLPYGVSEYALKMMTLHLYKHIGIVDAFITRDSKEDKTYYDLFIEFVQKGIAISR